MRPGMEVPRPGEMGSCFHISFEKVVHTKPMQACFDVKKIPHMFLLVGVVSVELLWIGWCDLAGHVGDIQDCSGTGLPACAAKLTMLTSYLWRLALPKTVVTKPWSQIGIVFGCIVE